MPIGLEPYVAERILFVRYLAPVNPEADVPVAIQAVADFHQKVQSEFFVIADARQFPITFDALVDALDLVRRQLVGLPIRFAVIGDGDMIRMAAGAIAQKQYGGFEAAKVFATDEEAFAYCMEELRKSA